MLSALRVAATALRNTYGALVPLAVINMMWVASCFTVVLLPPATAALFEIGHRVASGHQPTLGDFPRAMRRHFVRAWLWAPLAAAVVGVAAVNVAFYQAVDAAWAPLVVGLFGAAGLFAVVAVLFVWPYVFVQDEPRLGRALRNSALTVAASPGFSLGIALVVVLAVAVSVALLVPIAALTGSYVAVLANRAVDDRLRAYGKLGRSAPGDTPSAPAAAGGGTDEGVHVDPTATGFASVPPR